jgi:hypothetical protein
MNITLWFVQVLVALGVLMAGVMKATRPVPALNAALPWTKDVGMPFTRFIGTSELLGAIGLIVPAATKIAPALTLAAAGGLALVMLSAIVFHLRRGETNRVAPSLVLLLLVLFILVGRLTWAPLA